MEFTFLKNDNLKKKKKKTEEETNVDERPSEHNNAAPVEPRPRPIKEYSVLQKLRTLNPNKASGPDQIPFWLLKDNADILADPVVDILNSSSQESRLPKSWKRTDITPLPKQ